MSTLQQGDDAAAAVAVAPRVTLASIAAKIAREEYAVFGDVLTVCVLHTVNGFTSRDSVTNTRITTQVTALSAADRALGERIDTVTTEFKAADSATSTRITDSVAALSAADEAIGKRVDSIVTDVTMKDTATRAEISRVELASSTRDTALGQRIDTAVTDYTGRDSATNTRITTQVTALSAADKALGERIDTVTTDFKAADAATSTRIINAVTALSDADAATGRRVDSIVTDVTTKDTATRAEIGRVELASSTRDTALGQRIDTVTADYQSANTATNTRITDTSRALANATTAVGERASVLESQASPSGGNLVPNSSLSTLDGWVLVTNPQLTSTMSLNRAAQPFMIGGIKNNLTLHRPSPGAGLCSEAQSAAFAVRPGSSIQLYAMTASHRCRAWVTVFFFNDSGYVGYAGENSALRINAGGQDLNAWDQTGVKEFIVPGGAVRATIALRSYDVENDGYAWFSRPFVTEVKPGTKTWVPYSAGNDRTVTASTRALVNSTATTLADADSAIGRRIDTITTDYVGRDSATNARVDQTASAMSEADRALGIRVDGVAASLATTDSAVRAEIGRVERTSVDRDTALGQRSDTITASLNDARGRLSTVETAVTDGRFAAAQRVSSLEAQVGADLSARIDQRATAIVDPKIGVVTQSVTDLRSAYNGTEARVQQQAGTLVDLAGKATAYVRLLADGGNGVARLSLWSDQFGGAWELIGDGRIGGNLVVDGTITSTKMGASSVQQAMFLTLPGSMSIPYG